jgi:hypothetical protein
MCKYNTSIKIGDFFRLIVEYPSEKCLIFCCFFCDGTEFQPLHLFHPEQILYNYCTWTRSIWGFMEQSTTILNEAKLHKTSYWSSSSVVIVLLHKILENFEILQNFWNFEFFWKFWLFFFVYCMGVTKWEGDSNFIHWFCTRVQYDFLLHRKCFLLINMLENGISVLLLANRKTVK